MDSWIIDVVGNDPTRAKAIIRTKVGRDNLRFVVRELPDMRSPSDKEYDKNAIVLWTLNGWVHRLAQFDLPRVRSKDWSDEEEFK